MNVDYSRSPIVTGDANNSLAPGARLPGTIQVQLSHGHCRLNELAHRAGHTLMLLGGQNADLPALAELHTALQERIADSPLFEAAIVLSTCSDAHAHIGRIEPFGADLFGIQGTTLLVVRPDGYIGLRSDGDHMSVLERYRKFLHGAHP